MHPTRPVESRRTVSRRKPGAYTKRPLSSASVVFMPRFSTARQLLGLPGSSNAASANMSGVVTGGNARPSPELYTADCGGKEAAWALVREPPLEFKPCPVSRGAGSLPESIQWGHGIRAAYRRQVLHRRCPRALWGRGVDAAGPKRSRSGRRWSCLGPGPLREWLWGWTAFLEEQVGSGQLGSQQRGCSLCGWGWRGRVSTTAKGQGGSAVCVCTVRGPTVGTRGSVGVSGHPHGTAGSLGGHLSCSAHPGGFPGSGYPAPDSQNHRKGTLTRVVENGAVHGRGGGEGEGGRLEEREAPRVPRVDPVHPAGRVARQETQQVLQLPVLDIGREA